MDKSMELVFSLLARAKEHPDGGEAMKLAQAALNAANALCSLAALLQAGEDD